MTRKADFLMQKVGGEHLLVPLGAEVLNLNGLITLNDTAAHVWELLAGRHDVDSLAAGVAAKFDVAPDAARVDVQALVDEMSRLGLLDA